MINSRKIEDLHPIVQKLCKEFVSRCKDEGITVLITSTHRDFESQQALYDQGRTAPGKKVTNAKPGHSYHNFKVAFDFVPVIGGIAQWNDVALFKRCGAIAKDVGLDWGGDWVKFKDLPHCQYTGGLSLAEFRAGKNLVEVNV